MAYQGRGNSSSNGVNMDEITSILQQVQSGHLSLQQELGGQGQGQGFYDIGPNLNTNFPTEGSGTGQYEEDSGLSLLQSSNIESKSNYFTQPLRRPGRSVGSTQDDTTLSKSAIQKQLFAARMLGAPPVKLPGQSGPSVKPNLAASRTGKGTPSQMMGSSSTRQQQSIPKMSPSSAGLLGPSPGLATGLGMMPSQASRQQGMGNSTGNWTPNFSSSSQGKNNDSSFGRSQFSNQSNFQSQGMLGSGSLGFSQDSNFRYSDMNKKTSTFQNTSSSMMNTSTGQLNQSSGSSSFATTGSQNLMGPPSSSLNSGSMPAKNFNNVNQSGGTSNFSSSSPNLYGTNTLTNTASSSFGTGTLQKSFGAGSSPISFGIGNSPNSYGIGTSPNSYGVGSSPNSFGAGTSPNSFGAGASPNSFMGGTSPMPFTGVPPPSSSGISTSKAFTSIPPPSLTGTGTFNPPRGVPPPSSNIGFSGVPPPVIGVGSYSGVPSPSSGGSFSSIPPPSNKALFSTAFKASGKISSSGAEDSRKRKLQDELSKYEKQVGPGKQRKTSSYQNKTGSYQGDKQKSSRWSSADASPASDPEASPYQWSTNFVPDDIEEESGNQGGYEEIDVEGWIDSLVTYKEGDKMSVAERKQEGRYRSERSRRRSASPRGRRRSASPRSRRMDPKRASSRDRPGRSRERGRSAERDRPRLPLRRRSAERDRPRSPLSRRSPVRSKPDARPRRSLSPLGTERGPERGRNQLGRDAREGRRSPVGSRRQRSPPKNDRGLKSPNQDIDARRTRVTNRSPRREREDRARSDQRSSERDSRSREQRDLDAGRSGRRETEGVHSKDRQSEKGKLDEESKKTNQSSEDRGSRSKDEKSGEKSKRGSYQPVIIRPEEKKSIKINLAWNKGSEQDKDQQSGTKADDADQEIQIDNHLARLVGDDSIQHQISLFTKLDMESYLKSKHLVAWFCYLCQMTCDSKQGYLKHVMDKKHKYSIATAASSSGKPIIIKYLQTLPVKPESKTTKSSSKGTEGPTSSTANDSGKGQDGRHGGDGSSGGSRSKGHTCYECGLQFKGAFRDHKLTDEHKNALELLCCPFCDVRFNDKKALSVHYFSPGHIRKEKSKKKQDAKYEKERRLAAAQQQADNAEPMDNSNEMGMELIIPVFGYFCRACSKFYNNEKISRKVHSVDPDHLEKVKLYYDKQNQDKPTALAKAIQEKDVHNAKDSKPKENDSKPKDNDSKPKDNDSKPKENDSKMKKPDSKEKETAPTDTASKEVKMETDQEIVDLTDDTPQDEIVEIDVSEKNEIETLDESNCDCARTRVYIRKARKIDTTNISTTEGATKSTQDIPVGSEGKNQEVVGKSKSDESKSNEFKVEGKTGSKVDASTDSSNENSTIQGSNEKAKDQKSEVKGNDVSTESKADSSKLKSKEESPSNSQNKDMPMDDKKQDSSNPSKKDESSETTKEKSKSTPSKEMKLSEEKDEDKISKRSSSRSRDSESRGRSSDRNSNGDKDSSSRDRSSRSTLPSRESISRSNRRERSKGRSSSRGRESGSRSRDGLSRSSSHGRDTSSRSSIDRSERIRTPDRRRSPHRQRSSERRRTPDRQRSTERRRTPDRQRSTERRRTPDKSERRDDRTKSRSQTPSKSKSSSSKSESADTDKSESFDKDKSESSGKDKSESSGKDQLNELEAPSSIECSPNASPHEGEDDGEEDDGFDEEAMQAMMGSMGDGWEVLSEAEETEES